MNPPAPSSWKRARSLLGRHLRQQGSSSGTRLSQEWLGGDLPPPHPPPADVLRVQDLPGRRCEHYVLVELLGQGAMGEVWKAWDTRLHRWAAIKFLKFRNPRALQRFIREARVMAQLSHPNLVSVYDAGTSETTPYIAMQFAGGRRVGDRKLDGRQAAGIVRDAARGLHAAHQRGIIHRDVKPDNLLLDGDGRVLVTDFGLAHLDEDAGVRTDKLSVLGTPAFMSPEQAGGAPGEVTPATDVFGLGATLYALATGVPPIGGRSTPEAMRRAFDAAFDPPRRIEPSIPADLEAVILKAMAREPAHRYADAETLARDLDRFLAGEPVEAGSAGPLARSVRRAIRRPVRLALAAGAALLLAGAGTWIVRASSEANESRRLAELQMARRRAEEELRPARMAMDRWVLQGLAVLPADVKAVGDSIASALAASPGYGPAWMMKAKLVWVTRGYVPEVEAAYEKAASDPVSLREVLLDRAEYRVNKLLSSVPPGPVSISLATDGPEFAGAEEDLRRIPAGEGPHELKRRYLGAILRVWRTTRTEECLEAAHSMQPALSALVVSPGEGYFNQAFAFARANRLAEAEAAYSRAIEGGARNFWAWNNRGAVRTRMPLPDKDPIRFLEDTVKDFDRALSKFPGHPTLLANRAIARRQLGKHRNNAGGNGTPDLLGALEDCDKLLKDVPGDPQSLRGRALVRVMLGLREMQAGRSPESLLSAAIRDFQESAEREPLPPDFQVHAAEARVDLGHYCCETGRPAGSLFPEALRLVDEAIERTPDKALAHFTRARALIGIAQTEEVDSRDFLNRALTDLTRTLEFSPRYFDALIQRGRLRLALNLPKLALADFEEALRLSPGQAPVIQPMIDEARSRGD